jgi:hypothetical protein
MTASAAAAVLPLGHVPPVASVPPARPEGSSPRAQDLAEACRRASNACDRARRLREQARGLHAQISETQAIAESRTFLALGQPAGMRKALLQRCEYARLLARLQTMPVIEQAKGIIMAQSSYSEDQAFDLLRRTSQRQNVPVRELAAHIVAKAAGSPEASGGRRTQPRAAHR